MKTTTLMHTWWPPCWTDCPAAPGGTRPPFRLTRENSLGAGLARLARRRVDVIVPDLTLPDSNIRMQRPYRLAVSLGTTHYDWKKPADMEALLAKTDEAMYQLKRKKSTQ